ncbi:MAG: hypothetical protein CL931_12640 [Deltaproteobacteria bacterium]|nr:hypothetical protein [Deltaproteobacteria bacterium]
MRLIPRTLLGAFLALSLSSVAGAEAGKFSLTAELELEQRFELELDQRFELELADTANGRLLRLSGPSTMSCSHALTAGEIDTCVVTAEGTPRPAMPAAIAAN